MWNSAESIISNESETNKVAARVKAQWMRAIRETFDAYGDVKEWLYARPAELQQIDPSDSRSWRGWLWVVEQDWWTYLSG